MDVIKTISDMKAWSRQAKKRGLRIGFVPTMGFLHDGHLDLVRYCRQNCDRLVVSIFVNPKQFGPREDLSTYPRDLERDLALLKPMGVDAVFCPDAAEIYPDGFQTVVDVTRVTLGLCGAVRPAFFRGVATVVLKLFNIVQPDIAVFGQKDYQQLVTIKRLVRDLHLDIEIVGRPTVREPDGLAMSSRNIYLAPDERRSALSLSQALELARTMAAGGTVDSAEILQAVRTHIEACPGTSVQYALLVDPDTMEEVSLVNGRALLALAVIVGRTRLIDNAVITSP